LLAALIGHTTKLSAIVATHDFVQRLPQDGLPDGMIVSISIPRGEVALTAEGPRRPIMLVPLVMAMPAHEPVREIDALPAIVPVIVAVERIESAPRPERMPRHHSKSGIPRSVEIAEVVVAKSRPDEQVDQ
jgi:hypothetical protein